MGFPLMAASGTLCRPVPSGGTGQLSQTDWLSLRIAIDAHLRWKDRLENYVHGVCNEELTCDGVAADDRCLLGQWIYGPGMACFGQSAIFTDLIRAHARFHGHAAGIVAAVQRGDLAEAMDSLEVGDYPGASGEVKVLLARLYGEASRGLSGPGRFGGNP